ncbi:MAG: hypothetical protein HGA68_05130, partial [Methanothrix sp.]|nr:hypothetical protein [Methanothrix sp.]
MDLEELDFWEAQTRCGEAVDLKLARDLPDDTPDYILKMMEDFEEEGGWEEVIRKPSPSNPLQKKTRVEIKRRQKGDEVYILCLSEGRKEKDRAIREKQQE